MGGSAIPAMIQTTVSRDKVCNKKMENGFGQLWIGTVEICAKQYIYNIYLHASISGFII